ncbi:MAG: hypothetical protein EOP51_09395 [Sphingobacteriales bacterium]|nr:MAG: hypothetical protein EOP51_09395 [Sphingobacteriales bacterium]
MKRFLLAGLIMMGVCQTAIYAQSGNSYEDDIYYNSKDAKRDAQRAKRGNRASEQQATTNDQLQSSSTYDTYSSSGNYATDNGGDNSNYAQSYNSDGDVYIDYDDDSYSTRIQRFGYPSYAGYYDPFWFDSWYSPYYSNGMGYRPGFSVGFGYGPYWSSYWGYSSWYGYPGFYSAWNYPYYACNWGYGYGGYYGGYGNGYYDGYAGAYNSNRPSPTYGPRTSMNTPNYGYANRSVNNVRSALAPANNLSNNTMRSNTNNMRMAPSQNGNLQNANTRPAQMRANRADMNNSMNNGSVQPQRRGGFFQRADDNNARQMNSNAGIQPQQEQPRRARLFGGNVEMRQQSGNLSEGRPARTQSFEQSQPARSQQNIEQRSYSSPSRSSSPSFSSPSRSSGGSFSSPSRGGGSFGGGRR